MNFHHNIWALPSAIMGIVLYSTVEAITVNTTNDADHADGLCSLREAITAVNNGASYNECIFTAAPEKVDFSVIGTITLLSALPDVENAVTIAGPGAANLTVDGNTFNVFLLPFTGLARDVSITGLSITNASGAVYVDQNNTLKLSDCTVIGNDGPGVVIYGALTMERCLVDSNNGGGLNLGAGSSGDISDSTITNNTLIGGNGAGIYNAGNLDIVNTTISDNIGDQWAGGIFNNGILRLIRSTVSGNDDTQGGAGIVVQGDTVISNSTISGNMGDGIYVTADASATLDMYSSTITGNQDDGLDNSKIVGLNNTILAGNAGKNCTNSQAISSYGYNLEDSNDCVFNNTGDRLNTDPLLGPLQDNGGPTFTHALLARSPAIDAGDPNGCSDPWGILVTDQRGVMRQIDGNGDGADICDIGAYEWAGVVVGGGGGGGGGCRLHSTARSFDPFFPLLMLVSASYLLCRRESH